MQLDEDQILHTLVGVVSHLRSARQFAIQGTTLEPTTWPDDLPAVAPLMPGFSVAQLRSDSVPSYLRGVQEAKAEGIAVSQVVTVDGDELNLTIAAFGGSRSALSVIVSSDRPSLGDRPAEHNSAPTLSFTLDDSGRIVSVGSVGPPGRVFSPTHIAQRVDDADLNAGSVDASDLDASRFSTVGDNSTGNHPAEHLSLRTSRHVRSTVATALGDASEDLVDQMFFERVYPDDIVNVQSMLDAISSDPDHPQLRRARLRTSGGWRWFEVFGVMGQSHIPSRGNVIRITAVDVHDETLAVAELRRNLDRFSLLADSMPFGVFLADLSGPIEMMNEEFRSEIGRSVIWKQRMRPHNTGPSREIGRRFQALSWWDFAHEDYQLHVIDTVTNAGIDVAADHELAYARDGEGERYCRIHVCPVTATAGPNTQFIGVMADITDERRDVERLRKASLTDPLTGLKNRRAIQDEYTALRTQLSADPLAVLFIDVDGLDQVNNTYGYETGDRVMMVIASRLQDRTRDGDIVGRYNGTSFVAISTQKRGISGGLSLAHDIRRLLSAPIAIENSSARPKVSIGVALVGTNDGAGPADLAGALADASAAMYEGKSANDGGVRAATAGMRMKVARRLRLEADIGPAIHSGALRMVYQPICDTNTQRLTAAEALVRWNHHELGEIPPPEILDVSAAAEVLDDLAAFCSNSVARDLTEFRTANPEYQNVRFGLNASPVQLRSPHYVSMHLAAINRHGLHPADVVVEITECEPIDEDQAAASTIHNLVDAGVDISLDDFGSGYSSLEYLTRLPIRSLKIDRSIVRQLGHTESARKIIAGVQALCASLDIVVLAEGVESSDELSACRAAGISRVQGYALGRPGDLDSLTRRAPLRPPSEPDPAKYLALEGERIGSPRPERPAAEGG